MSTNHTPHFNLSQWEPGDQVVRTEFNENHAKIEHAFFNHRSAELISTLTVTAESNRLLYDISYVDWDRYMMVVMFLDTASDGGFRFNADPNQETTQQLLNTSVYKRDVFLDIQDVNHLMMLFPVFYDGNRRTIAIGLGSDLAAEHSGFTDSACVKNLNQLDTISMWRVTSGSMFLPGDKVELWGIK